VLEEKEEEEDLLDPRLQQINNGTPPVAERVTDTRVPNCRAPRAASGREAPLPLAWCVSALRSPPCPSPETPPKSLVRGPPSPREHKHEPFITAKKGLSWRCSGERAGTLSIRSSTGHLVSGRRLCQCRIGSDRDVQERAALKSPQSAVCIPSRILQPG
jgi:hypothetical protein